MHIILHEGHICDSTSIAVDALGALVNFSYNLDENDYHSLSKSASGLLDAVTERLLDYVLKNSSKNNVGEKTNEVISDKGEDRDPPGNLPEKGKCATINIYELLMNNLRVTTQALQSYCASQLIAMLTHRPDMHVASVLKSQEKWRSTLANPLLSSMMQKLVIVIGYEAALQSLNSVVTNEEVNWVCVLTLVAVSINCHKLAVPLLKGIIEEHIRSGCKDQDMEALVIGFIFARHSSQEGRHLFPSYSQWFSALFATESGSPAANKQSFVFLIKFLTDLVPHDPSHCLRAHLNSHIFVPKGCQDLLRDYINLGRARLRELKDNLDCSVTSRQNQQEKDEVMKEVETSIEHFSQTGRIPNFVLEASMFRKPYYRSSFLPTLLTPRILPDDPDARSKFIDSLHSSGKIPSGIYKSYIEECKKITSDLLSGVFTNIEEEITIEEPITELSYILNELIDSTSVLPVLSRVSHKIEELMKTSDLKLKDSKHLILNPRFFNSKLVSYQVIQEFENILKKIFHQDDGMAAIKPDWLPQFISLLSSSMTLQSSLFNYLLYNLECGQHQQLSENKLRIQGLLLSEICKIEGLFLPVVESSTMVGKAVNFVSFFMDKLENNLFTKYACVHTCKLISHWLKLHINTNSNEEDSFSSVPLKLINLYCFLAPRISLIQSEEDQELTMALVSPYLDGQSVPDCTRLYFDCMKNLVRKNNWMPLEKWILYELCATWENTPLDVRMIYLQSKIQQDYLLDNSEHRSSGNDVFGEILLEIIAMFLQAGAKENSREMIMLLQRLSVLYPDVDICLLEEWQSIGKQQPMNDRSLSQFMNLCRCLPPPYFLPSKRLLQLSGVLEQLVDMLKISGEGLQMNLNDTVFLVSCLLHAAKDPSVKDMQLQKCLRPITTAIIFHWESVKRYFEDNSHILPRFRCLVTLHSILKDLMKNLNQLSLDEGGIALLSLGLTKSNMGEAFQCDIPAQMRGHFLKWLFAYLGLQQLEGSIPVFPSDSDDLHSLKEKERGIINICRKELQEYLMAFDPLNFVEVVFPVKGENLLSLKMVPMSCTFVILLELTSPETKNKKNIDRDRFEVKLFEILLLCHIFMSQEFDQQENKEMINLSVKEDEKSASKLSTHREVKYIKDVEYIADLYHSIFSLLHKIPPKMLGDMSKKTIENCDAEIKSTLKSKLKGVESDIVSK